MLVSEVRLRWFVALCPDLGEAQEVRKFLMLQNCCRVVTGRNTERENPGIHPLRSQSAWMSDELGANMHLSGLVPFQA